VKDIKEPSEILEYLKTPPVISGGVSVLIRQIDQAQKNLSEPTDSALKNLAARRALASNSLKKEEALELWQETNHWMGEKITEDEVLTWASIVHLNRRILGRSESLRDFKIYTGDMEYLPPEHLGEALDEFHKKLQFEPDIFIKSFEIYLGIVTIHPFNNANGRTARLAADWILMRGGYLPVCFDSPIQSHVAVTLNHPKRDKQHSFEKFLRAVLKSYQILEQN
jgi:Fic family protein